MHTYILTKKRNGHQFSILIASVSGGIEDARKELRDKFRLHLSERFHFVTQGELIETLESGEEIRETRPSGYYQDANFSLVPEYDESDPIVGTLDDWNKAAINSWDWDVWTFAIEAVEIPDEPDYSHEWARIDQESDDRIF